jgi:acetyl esterase
MRSAPADARYQVRVFPVVDYDMTTPSSRKNANAKPLNRATMKYFFDHAATSQDTTDSDLAPFTCLPERSSPTSITAQIDPPRSAGAAFAAKIKDAGVKSHLWQR